MPTPRDPAALVDDPAVRAKAEKLLAMPILVIVPIPLTVVDEISIDFDTHLCERLDEAAARRDESRQSFIRSAVREKLDRERRHEDP